jgi:DNA repair exonuclease SbcCD ATPase subunit
MISCELEGFYCKSHSCGMLAGGELSLCLKEGCPHCGKGVQKISGRKYKRLVEEHGRAQAAALRWEVKLDRALTGLKSARVEVKKLQARLEKAEREGVEPEAEEDV